MRRLLAIGVIWAGCTGAWALLGNTLLVRSSTSHEGLGASVQALWGPALQQRPPSAFCTWQPTEGLARRPAPLEGTDLDVRLELEHRRKGLLWFPTYAVEVKGRYAFRNVTDAAREVEVSIPLQQDGVVYDGFSVTDAEGKPVEVSFADGAASFTRVVAAGAALPFTVAYGSRGTRQWTYGTEREGLGPEPGRARQVRIAVTTDFPDVDFPAEALSPTSHAAAGGGWRGEWRFDQLVGSKPVAISLPQKLNPGPLAARLTFFAPVGLLFFFFVTAVLLAATRRSIHPMNYVLLACAFFAFHLLFAYLIDHLEIAPAFALASLVSVGLVVSYARLFLGWRVAVQQLGVPQLLYLVLFSLTFFWQGFTGLAVTVGAILTLFVIMQITGKVDWAVVLAPASARPEAPPPMPPPMPPPVRA